MSLILDFVIDNAFSLISTPIAFLLSSKLSITVVPLPTNWSKTTSSLLEYLINKFFTTYGLQFPG